MPRSRREFAAECVALRVGISFEANKIHWMEKIVTLRFLRVGLELALSLAKQ